MNIIRAGLEKEVETGKRGLVTRVLNRVGYRLP
jgi:hypothetical protein